MKTIGLIGGMSWESSIEYYRLINETVKSRLGGFHSAKSIMYSVDFAEVELLQRQGCWEEAAQLMVAAAQNTERGGADFVVFCTNTMHKVADEVQKNINIPILHIADVTARKIQEAGFSVVGLLGTRFTMEEEFYTGRLRKTHGLTVLTPNSEERDAVHRVIFEELCLGRIVEESRLQFIQITARLIDEGAQAVILGCTETGLLLRPVDVKVPLFDTTRIHAVAAVEYALGEDEVHR